MSGEKRRGRKVHVSWDEKIRDNEDDVPWQTEVEMFKE